jgi:hypothetical protein
VTDDRAQILYISAYTNPEMSLALDSIISNSYISAYPRMYLALDKAISNSYVAAYAHPRMALELAPRKFIKISYIASCNDT